MVILKPPIILSSEITPENVYLSRRQFLKSLGVIGVGALLSACSGSLRNDDLPTSSPDPQTTATTDELGDALTPYSDVTTYNNYYEFGSDKQSPAERAGKLKISPWEVKVSGLVHRPGTFGLEDLLRRFVQEERVYRLRCVEGWSMVIPWIGFPLARLLKEVEPMSGAKYIRFETIYAPDQMQNQQISVYPWPYSEGLRLDEALHDLTILATGLYGYELPPQNGAPVRLVVPWKYGFKSIKSIVKIELVSEKPSTFWNSLEPVEYGFFANVNPDVDHARWSQRSERRIGENSRRKTLMFNGYADKVRHLYSGMDLRIDY